MVRNLYVGLALALLTSPSLAAGDLCPLLGPDFPAPIGLKSSDAFKKAATAFEARLAKIAGASDASAGNAWSISVSSAASNETLYERHFTPDVIKNSTHGVKKIDGDSVYRVGSISKVFTVYTFLAALGDAHFNDPISKYVPELKNAKKLPLPNGAVYDDINNVEWDGVTLGNLASQLSGIERDLSLGDLSATTPPEMLKAGGLPVLNGSDVPTCGAAVQQGPCNRTEFFPRLLQAHPAFPTSHSPAYSNIAFEILAYAFESLSGKTDFGKAMEESIFGRLGMKGSSYYVPKSDANAVIPGGNATLTSWNWSLGIDSAGGGIFSSTNDMIVAARSILASTILNKAQTRRWLRPLSNVAQDNLFVGAPWEMRRIPLPNGGSTDLYNKNGDIGLYNSALLLSPDHQLAITIMASGAGASNLRTELAAALANTFFAGAEEGARDEAKANYAGTYTDKSTSSSVTIATDDKTGLRVDKLISRGASSIEALFQTLHLQGTAQPRLYPTTLKTLAKSTKYPTGNGTADSTGAASADGTYTSRTGWRLVFLPPFATGNTTSDDHYTSPCETWFSVDAPQIGNVGFDDMVFNLGEDGKAASLEMRGFRLTLTKQK